MSAVHPASYSSGDAALDSTGYRVAAVVAVLVASVSAAAHLVPSGHSGATALTSIMAAGCMVCGVHVCRRPSIGAWVVTALMSTVMIAVHLATMDGRVGVGHAHHEVSVPVNGASTAMHLPVYLGALELIVSGSVVWIATQSRRPGILSESSSTQWRGTTNALGPPSSSTTGFSVCGSYIHRGA